MKLNRTEIKLVADPKRVILLPFNPGNEIRIINMINRILSLSDSEVSELLKNIYNKFKKRHYNLDNSFQKNYSLVSKYVSRRVSQEEELLIGAYFSKEYSIESAALFNPSIVPHPDQSNLNDGELRFIISLRATGEGHISSIEFLTGIIDNRLEIRFDELPGYSVLPSKRNSKPVITHLVDADMIESNYDIEFSGREKLSERVIFPYSKTESNGIEDARFVKFLNSDGSYVYYATFTAYDGHRIISELIETYDFFKFSIRTLTGNGAKDKGMALFPEKINDKFWMISRQDGENIFIMNSPNIFEWNNPEILKIPQYSWEFVQVGNCGSPLKTKDGWLLLTHAVGTLRTYVISAILLDLNNPAKVIGHLREPLLIANDEEREGYVPNVVYSCGSLIFNEYLIIPFAMSDSASSFATISVSDLLGMME
ncbi:MAG: glycoside hydrolase family 130 protein [Ignavibacteriaceae bacterium]|nr:glycoside hydrolase family 130 protein [Ignavibacteriaceae bacterium]